MDVLITLLGRTGRSADGYKKLTYRFPDGSTDQASFLGWPLQKRLKPKRLIVLGTSTSMWDHLFEGDIELKSQAEDLRLELFERVSSNQPVEPALLDSLRPLLGKALGCDVRLVQVPDGVSEDDQINLFKHLSEHLPPTANLYLDCTHGYRHMPMLMLAAAQFTAGLGRGSIKKIFYGRVDSSDDSAEVFELQGLAQLQMGVTALSVYDRTGDLEPILEFLEPYLSEGVNLPVIRKAVFHERLLRVSGDHVAFRQLFEFLRDQELPFPANLFQKQISARVAWSREPLHHRRQLALAKQALEGLDYLRALALLLETMISFSVHENELGNPDEREVREHAQTLLYERLKGKKDLNSSFNKLNNLRNSVVHGVKSERSDIENLLRDEKRLRTFLERVLPAIDEFTAASG